MARHKRVISAALAVLLAVGGFGYAHGVVLCLAADGHAEFEFALEMGCSEFPAAKGGATGAAGLVSDSQSRDEPHCGSCVDIPLGIGHPAGSRYLIPQGSQIPVQVPVASGSFFSPSASDASRCAPEAHCVCGSALSSLRAVVLLI